MRYHGRFIRPGQKFFSLTYKVALLRVEEYQTRDFARCPKIYMDSTFFAQLSRERNFTSFLQLVSSKSRSALLTLCLTIVFCVAQYLVAISSDGIKLSELNFIRLRKLGSKEIGYFGEMKLKLSN